MANTTESPSRFDLGGGHPDLLESAEEREARFYRFINQPNFKKKSPAEQVQFRAKALKDLGLSEESLLALRADPLGLRIGRAALPFGGMVAGGLLGGPAGAGLGLLAGEMGTGGLAKAYKRPGAHIVPSPSEAQSAVMEGILGDITGRVIPPLAFGIMGGKAAQLAGREAITEATESAVSKAAKAREAAQASLATQAQVQYRAAESSAAKEALTGLKGRQEQKAVSELQSLLKQTPAEAEKLAKYPVTEEVAKAIGGVRGARQRGLHELGQGFNEIFGPIESNLVEPEVGAEIGDHVGSVVATSQQRGERLASTTEKLLQEIRDVPKADDLMEAWKNTGKTGDPRLDALLEMRSKMGPIDRAEFFRLAFENKPPNIGRIRGINSRVIAAAEKAPSAVDRRVLFEASQPLRDILDDAVPQEQQAVLAKLKNEYRQINKQLPWRMMRKVNAASSLSEIGDIVFFKQSSDRALRLIREVKLRGNPDELALMRGAFASRLLTKGGSSYRILSKDLVGRDEELRELFGATSPFGTAAKVAAAARRQIALRNILRSDPQALAEYRAGIRMGIQDWLRRPQTQALLRARQTQPELSGIPSAMRQGQISALQAHAGLSGMGRYIQHRLTFDAFRDVAGLGALGYGAVEREPAFLVGAGAYLLKRHAWAKWMENPAHAAAYRDFLFSPSWQARGRMAARMITAGVTEGITPNPMLGEQNAP